MKAGDRYNWKQQPERLVYMGLCEPRNGVWHQFAKVESPDVVWCEVLDSDLHMLEPTSYSRAYQPVNTGECMLIKLLKDLREAMAFDDKVKADPEGAVETGAEWLKTSRLELANYLLSVTAPGDSMENLRPAFEAAVIANQAKEVFDEPDFTRCPVSGEYQVDLIEAGWWGYKAGKS